LSVKGMGKKTSLNKSVQASASGGDHDAAGEKNG